MNEQLGSAGLAPAPTSPIDDAWRSYERAHLKGGPDSDRLEFNTEYYVLEMLPKSEDAYPFDKWLQEEYREKPTEVSVIAAGFAATTAIYYFHTEGEVYRSVDSERFYEGTYQRACRLGIITYIQAGEIADDALEDLIDGIEFTDKSWIDAKKQREAARLAIQTYRVYKSAALGQGVPEL